jgi:hypothetical protein
MSLVLRGAAQTAAGRARGPRLRSVPYANRPVKTYTSGGPKGAPGRVSSGRVVAPSTALEERNVRHVFTRLLEKAELRQIRVHGPYGRLIPRANRAAVDRLGDAPTPPAS